MTQQTVKRRVIEHVSSQDTKTRRWKSTFAAARMAYEAGELKQADRLLARAHEMARALPERSFALHATEIGQAAVWLAQKRWKEAAPSLESIITELESAADNAHRELLAVALRFHAQALADGGDEREAEKELKQSSEILRELGKDAYLQLAYTLSDLCGLYVTQGRFSEAERQITRAIEIADQVLGHESAEYIRADMIYQLCLPMTEETRLDTASDGIMKIAYRQGAKHPNIAHAIERYLKALRARGDSARLAAAEERFGVRAAIKP